MASSPARQENARSAAPAFGRDRKFILATAGCVLAVIALFAAHQRGATTARMAADAVGSHSAPIVLALQDMRFGAIRIVASTSELLVLYSANEEREAGELGERRLIEHGQESFTDAMRRFARLDAGFEHGGGEGAAVTAAMISTAYDAMIEVTRGLIALSERGAGIDEIVDLKEVYEDKESALLELIDSRLAKEQRIAETALGDAVLSIDRMNLETMLMGTITLVVIVVYAFYVNRLVRRLLGEISHRERVEKALVQANAELALRAAKLGVATKQAEFANRSMSEFLANMSHELRTPLNAVIGFSDMIRSESFGSIGSPKYLEYAKDINGAGIHLLELINDILDLSKIEAGKMELHEENIDVSRVLRTCVTLVKERTETGGVTLECDTGFDLPALYADERKLKQILINLLSNAAKFTPSGGKIAMKAWFRSDDGYVFQVSDTGIGIASEDISRALASFSQIDGDLSRKYEGTGLGLPLTKALAELHGGSLDLQSELGVGTTVTVRFPAERMVPRTALRASHASRSSPRG